MASLKISSNIVDLFDSKILSTTLHGDWSRALTTSASSHLVQVGQHHVTKGLTRIAPGVLTKGEGSYAVFEDGRRMLDFSCGIGVTNLGMSAQTTTRSEELISYGYKATVTLKSARQPLNSA
jgi:glutamate-1-semialdehyde aminotransferase